MARELTIAIAIDNTDEAAQALQKVEDRLQGVEKAAEKTGDAIEGVEDQAKDTGQELNTLDNKLKGVIQQFGKLGTGGVVAAAGAAMAVATKYALDYGASIDKAATNARVSTDAMQGLDSVAKKNGTTFAALANSMQQLDVKLSQGGEKVTRVVESLGMEVDDLLRLSRDDRFREMGIAIANIEDPAEQATAAFELLGAAGLDLLPVFRDMAAGADRDAPKMASAWVEATAEISRGLQDVIDKGIAYGKHAALWLTTWPLLPATWARAWSEAAWTVAGATSVQLPAMPGRPTGGMFDTSLKPFDPLNGQSMSFTERQLNQGVQRPRAGGRAPLGPMYGPAYVPDLVNGMDLWGGSNWNGNGAWMNRPTVPMNASNPILGATQNLNFAGYAPTVGMNRPGVSGGGFGNFFRSQGGRLMGMGLGMASGFLPGMSATGSSIGGGVGSAIGGIGKLAGSTLGSFLGPLGGIAGGLVGKLFGKKEGAKTNDTRDDFISQNFGSVDALRDAAEKAGFSVDKLLSVKKVKDFEAEVQKLNKALQEQEEDALRVNDAMERWGITVEEMGPKFKQTQINDVFKETLDDIRVLTNAGADFNTIAEKMAPTLGGMVQEAIEMGGTVPREMEPILKEMIELGILTDKNGDKFTDLSQIPFAADLNKDFTTLISKMDALISKISKLPGLFDDAADSAGNLAAVTPGGGDGGDGGGNDPSVGMDRGGVAGRVSSQHSMRDVIPAMLRPGERVLTPEQAGGGLNLTINGISIGAMSEAETAEQVGKAITLHLRRRGVRFAA
jgi:hypothetical protein